MHGSDAGEQAPRKTRRMADPRSPLSVADPQPPAAVRQIWRGAAQAATIGIFVILLIAALDLGRAVLLPVVSAFVVTMMLGPLQAHADRYRVPNLLTALMLWMLVIAAFYGLIVLLAAPVVEWIGKAPDIARSVQDKLHVLDAPIAALRDLRNALLPSKEGKGVSVDLLAFVQPVLGVLTPAIGEVLVFFGTLVLHAARAQPAAACAGRVVRKARGAPAHAQDHSTTSSTTSPAI